MVCLQTLRQSLSSAPMSTMMPAPSDLEDRAPAGTKAGGRASLALREETRREHEAVDAAFGAFRLGERDGYARFLKAHARILPHAERVIDPAGLLPGWQGRSGALARDLAMLGVTAAPRPVELVLPQGAAARWGALYVLEGSRLGGVVLSRAVPADLPAAYLGARHGPGGWRRILEALDHADEGADWRRDAAAGAKATFRAYLAAAETEHGND